MNIEFYIPKDERIPTDLRLKADGIDVDYERIIRNKDNSINLKGSNITIEVI